MLNKINLVILFLLFIITYFLLLIKNKPFALRDGYTYDPDLYIKPKIYSNFISIEECDKIINIAEDKLTTSITLGYQKMDLTKEKKNELEKVRKSKQTWISKRNETVLNIMNKISLIVNKPVNNFEDLQVVRYEPSEYYNEHHDACCIKHASCDDFIKESGQRLYTFLIYLSEDFTGGNTEFKNLNKKFKLNKGDAIFFHTLDKNQDLCHNLALHAGLPVISGIKWICNIWVREGDFSSKISL